MRISKTFQGASIAAACSLLAACGGGGGSSDSEAQAKALSTATAPVAAEMAVTMGIDGSFIFNLANQFPAPASTATAQEGAPTPTPQRLSLKQLVQVLQNLQNLPGSGTQATPDTATASVVSGQTVPCNGGGTYLPTTDGTTYNYSFNNCLQDGTLYNGQISAVYSNNQNVAYVSSGNFSGFSMAFYPQAGETVTTTVNGDLKVTDIPQTVEERLSSNSLRIGFIDTLAGSGSISASFTLLGFVQDSVFGGTLSDTLVTTQGRMVYFDPQNSFDVTINNTAQNDANQAVFHFLPTQTGPSQYPYRGSLFIKDNQSSATIVLSAINGNANYALLNYTLPSQVWTDTQLWSTLYNSGP